MSGFIGALVVTGIVAITVAVGVTAVDMTGSTTQPERVEWYAVNSELNAKGESLGLGDGVRALKLRNGWSCAVGRTSKNLPADEARTTICQKGSEAFQFVVQCEPSRPKDHTQIGFLAVNRQLADFVEVGCELRSR